MMAANEELQDELVSLTEQRDEARADARANAAERDEVKAETKKLREIKDHLIEKSKNRNSSYTIKVEDGSIRIIKYKRLIYYKLNERGFNKLDNQTKNHYRHHLCDIPSNRPWKK